MQTDRQTKTPNTKNTKNTKNMRATRKELEAVTNSIAFALGVPSEPYINTAAEGEPKRWRANVGAVYVSGAYGGYEIQQIANDAGGARSLVWEGHRPIGEAVKLARAFLAGVAQGKAVRFAAIQLGVE
jgi:hypothetical protein